MVPLYMIRDLSLQFVIVLLLLLSYIEMSANLREL